jgi:hypothetical protein
MYSRLGTQIDVYPSVSKQIKDYVLHINILANTCKHIIHRSLYLG